MSMNLSLLLRFINIHIGVCVYVREYACNSSTHRYRVSGHIYSSNKE